MVARKWMTAAFWLDTAERTARTGLQSGAAVLAANATGLVDVDWPAIGSISGLAALGAFLTSLIAGLGGDPATAGFGTRRNVTPSRPYSSIRE